MAGGLQVPHLNGEELGEVRRALLAAGPALGTGRGRDGRGGCPHRAHGPTPRLRPLLPSGHRGRWGRPGGTGRNLKREKHSEPFGKDDPAHAPQLLPSCLLAAEAADQESIGGQEPAYPRRCARDQTSARSPCCSTATPWLRRTRGLLHSNKNPVNLIPARDPPSVSPRFPAQAPRGDFACLWGQLEEAAGNRRAGQRWTWQLAGPALSPEAYFCPAPCSGTRRRPVEGMRSCGVPWGGQRAASACIPGHLQHHGACAGIRGATAPEQLLGELSIYLSSREGAESLLQREGRDFTGSQGKMCTWHQRTRAGNVPRHP